MPVAEAMIFGGGIGVVAAAIVLAVSAFAVLVEIGSFVVAPPWERGQSFAR